MAWIEGSLPTGLDPIQLPDLELSLNLDGMIFGLQSPAQGATYSASAISTSNPIQFVWSVYNQGESYFVELGQNNNDVPIWTSGETTSTNMMWDGTVDNGLHITAGKLLVAGFCSENHCGLLPDRLYPGVDHHFHALIISSLESFKP